MNILKKTACLLILCITIGSSAALAQMKWNSAYKAYVDQYKDLAIEQMLRYNIPASRSHKDCLRVLPDVVT